jgi:hypothetical protein
MNVIFSQEDELLIRLVHEHGFIRWCDIASHFQERSGKQCSERLAKNCEKLFVIKRTRPVLMLMILPRYQHYLCPGIAKDPWTREEDLAILSAHEVIGSKWKEM